MAKVLDWLLDIRTVPVPEPMAVPAAFFAVTTIDQLPKANALMVREPEVLSWLKVAVLGPVPTTVYRAGDMSKAGRSERLTLSFIEIDRLPFTEDSKTGLLQLKTTTPIAIQRNTKIPDFRFMRNLQGKNFFTKLTSNNQAT